MENNKDITELDVYRDALLFSNLIWKICLNWNYFEQKTIGIQLVRAADSISANIAEGFGRFSKKDKIRFYYYSLGSVYECIDWNNKCSERNTISQEEHAHIKKVLESLPREINQLIKYTNLKLKVSLLPTPSCRMTFPDLHLPHAKKSEIQQRANIPGHREVAGKRSFTISVL